VCEYLPRFRSLSSIGAVSCQDFTVRPQNREILVRDVARIDFIPVLYAQLHYYVLCTVMAVSLGETEKLPFPPESHVRARAY
jgi:hypothetical protein